MAITLNLTGEEIKAAQSNNIPPLAEGTYGAIVYEAKIAESRSKNQMYVLDFKITDGPEGIGRKQRGWFVLKPNALFSLIALNKAVDFPYPTKDTPAGEFEFADPEDYVGKEVLIKIIQQPFVTEDEDGNEVTGYRNNIKTVLKYDESKIDNGNEVVTKESGLFL